MHRSEHTKREELTAYYIIARKQGEDFFSEVKHTPNEQREWYQSGISCKAAEESRKILEAKGFEAYIVSSREIIDLNRIILSDCFKDFPPPDSHVFPY